MAESEFKPSASEWPLESVTAAEESTLTSAPRTKDSTNAPDLYMEIVSPDFAPPGTLTKIVGVVSLVKLSLCRASVGPEFEVELNDKVTADGLNVNVLEEEVAAVSETVTLNEGLEEV